jgi:hypothetical protein
LLGVVRQEASAPQPGEPVSVQQEPALPEVEPVAVRSASGSDLKASEVWAAVQDGPRTLDDGRWPAEIADGMAIDNPLDAVNISISLRNRGHYAPARRIAERILDGYPDYPFALFEIAFIEAALRRNAEALVWAERAALSAPDNLPIVSYYTYLLGAAGDAARGIRLLDAATPKYAGDHELQNYAIQYLTFIERFPHEQTHVAAGATARAGRFLDPAGVRSDIMTAVREARPYAFVRIGDGEGAWTFADPVDEAAYPNLFKTNRRSFLMDWFGSDVWLESPEFHEFARGLGDVFPICDLIGAPEQVRMFDEYDTMGRRGLPGQVNMLRRFGWMDPVRHTWEHSQEARFCSANVHSDLLGSGFYPELVRHGAPLGVITSYRELPQLLVAAGGQVEHAFFVPGDSRNFWADTGEQPLRQWPDVFNEVAARLRTVDLRGVVFLMAAGFVGKQDLPILKERGAVALDIGSMTNRWMEHGAIY